MYTYLCDNVLVPKTLVIDRYFKVDKEAIERLETKKEALTSEIDELTEEYSAAEGYFSSLDKVSKTTVSKQLKEIKDNKKAGDEIKALEAWLKLIDVQTMIKKDTDIAVFELDKKVFGRYKSLTEEEVKMLVVDDKWMTSIEKAIKTEMDRVSQALTQRIKQLAERYDMPLPKLNDDVAILEEKFNTHLQKMGFYAKRP